MDKKQKVTPKYMKYVLRRYRDLVGMSQQQLADSIGVSKGFISALEGGRRAPSIDLLLLIAEALAVRPGELVDALQDEINKSHSS